MKWLMRAFLYNCIRKYFKPLSYFTENFSICLSGILPENTFNIHDVCINVTLK